jgi:SNF2 family DNA or RNA helicase
MIAKTENNFKTVICLEKHPSLGFILQFHAVKELDSGKFSLDYEKIRINNADFYGLDDSQLEILKLAEEFEVDNLIKRFLKDKVKKRVTPSIFFEKYLNEDLVNNQIRPYLDKQLVKALTGLKGKTIYFFGRGNLPGWVPLPIIESPLITHFNAFKEEEGLHYFVTLKKGETTIKPKGEHNAIIVNKPGIVLINDQVFFLENKLEGKKLSPFFNKSFVQVPEQAVLMYLEKFIIPLFETHNVFIKGIDVEINRYEAQPVLSFMTFDKQFNVALKFKYGEDEHAYHISKKTYATLVKTENSYKIQVTQRSVEWEENRKKELLDLGFIQGQGSLFFVPENINLPAFIRESIPVLKKKGFEIEQTNLKNPFLLSEPKITYTVSKDNDWFDLKIIVKFGKFEIPFIKLKKNISEGNRYFELPDGSIAILPEEWMEKFPLFYDHAQASEEIVRFRQYHYNLLDEFDNLATNRSGDKIDSMTKAFKKQSNPEPPETFTAKLRKYQQTGLKWLCALHENKFGGLLADDMGLGKTIQALGYFQWYLKKLEDKKEFTSDDFSNHTEKTPKIPIIVVCPTSLVHNWQNEINRFADIKTFIYSGNQRNRYVWNYFPDYDLIITTYGTVRNDMDMLCRIKFRIALFDEAQNLKNPQSATAKACFDLNADQKLLLTGTPIENSITDLWSLMNLANPGYLGSYNKFVKSYGQKIEKEGNGNKITELKKFVEPFILRRTKEQVAKELPKRHEQTLYCEMSSEQEKIYEKTKSYFRNELLQLINNNGIEKSKLYVLKGLMKLRQLSNHPGMVEDEYKGSSGKFELILENISDVINRGHKVLLFSQFTRHLKLFKKELNKLGIQFAYLDGSTAQEDRALQVEKFQQDDNLRLFLISLKAGGVGLNLTAADYVFIADPWWNPAVERQAMDRAHRIGQTKPVFVYKFITEGSIEEKILKLQERKTQLAGNIISEENSWLSAINQDDIKELLA